MFWLFFSSISLLFATLGDNKVIHDKRLNNLFRCLLIISLSVVIGLGGIVATDHEIYVQKYLSFSYVNTIGDLINKMDLGIFVNLRDETADTMSIGMAILNFLLCKIGIGEVAYFLLIAIFVNSLLVKAIYRYSIPTLSVLVFITSTFFYQETNLVRQYIAVAVFVYSIKYIIEDNFKKYAICIFFAFLFHYSSMYLLPVFFINRVVGLKSLDLPVRLIPLAVWLISIFVAFDYIKIDFFNSSFVSNYFEVYFENRQEKIEFDIVFNLLTLYLLFQIFYTKKFIIDVNILLFVIGVTLLNFSVQFYMLFRFALFFNVINCFYIGSIFKEYNYSFSLNKIGIFLCSIYYVRFLLINNVLNEKVLLGSQMYSFADLLK